jgi:quaternary ammonium compound-resistance protein SugE
VGDRAQTRKRIPATLAKRDRPDRCLAIWVGIGTLGVAFVGILALDEPATPARLVFLAVIMVGVIGLTLADSRA